MKILVVFTGGTISSSMKDGYISPRCDGASELLEMYRQTNSEVEFEAVNPYTLLSENLNSGYMQKLVKCVKDNIDLYDGVIVVHGTDTLQYSAAALAYGLGLCEKCVVVVSANYILSDKRSNGTVNFFAAADFVYGGYGKGVFVSYANSGETAKIHRGNRILAHEMFTDDVKSVKNEFYGEFLEGKFVKNPKYTEFADEVEPIDFEKFDSSRRVIVKNVYPGMSFDDDLKNAAAVLVTTYHSGTVATADGSFEKFLKRAADEGVLVCMLGGEWESFYESAKVFENKDLKVCMLLPGAVSAMYVKLLFAPYAGEELAEFAQKPLGGER